MGRETEGRRVGDTSHTSQNDRRSLTMGAFTSPGPLGKDREVAHLSLAHL